MASPADQPTIRRATPGDAEAIVALLGRISAERIYTAIDRPWPADQQRTYIANLSRREAIHLAECAKGTIIGYQTLDLWAPILASMSHVGQLGTFLAPEWRRRGVGHALFRVTLDFAHKSDYEKFVIQVRAGNAGALSFYRTLGFRDCGRFSRQVKIDDRYEDEVLLEFFL